MNTTERNPVTLIITLVIAVSILLLSGCATKTEYITKPVEVKIPVKCELPTPKRPVLKDGPEGASSILKYAEELECTLKLCKGEVSSCK